MKMFDQLSILECHMCHIKDDINTKVVYCESCGKIVCESCYNKCSDCNEYYCDQCGECECTTMIHISWWRDPKTFRKMMDPDSD